jgi:hypothetical protein
LLDRIDLHMKLPAVNFRDITSEGTRETPARCEWITMTGLILRLDSRRSDG